MKFTIIKTKLANGGTYYSLKEAPPFWPMSEVISEEEEIVSAFNQETTHKKVDEKMDRDKCNVTLNGLHIWVFQGRNNDYEGKYRCMACGYAIYGRLKYIKPYYNQSSAQNQEAAKGLPEKCPSCGTPTKIKDYCTNCAFDNQEAAKGGRCDGNIQTKTSELGSQTSSKPTLDKPPRKSLKRRKIK